MSHPQHGLIWIDLELTGLDPKKDRIVEIAVVASDMKLTKFIRGPCMIINPELDCDYKLQLNEWCQSTFTQNGLLEEIRNSAVSIGQAREQVCEFVRDVSANGSWYLAGSSVHVDRQFLIKEMPDVVALLSYRIVDVSSFAVMSRVWAPTRMKQKEDSDKYDATQKKVARRNSDFLKAIGLGGHSKAVDTAPDSAEHRALSDIIRSIELLIFIKNHIIKKG